MHENGAIQRQREFLPSFFCRTEHFSCILLKMNSAQWLHWLLTTLSQPKSLIFPFSSASKLQFGGLLYIKMHLAAFEMFKKFPGLYPQTPICGGVTSSCTDPHPVLHRPFVWELAFPLLLFCGMTTGAMAVVREIAQQHREWSCAAQLWQYTHSNSNHQWSKNNHSNSSFSSRNK